MFCPDPTASRPDLLASTGDHLRVWRVHDGGDDGSGGGGGGAGGGGSGAGGVTLARLLSNVSALGCFFWQRGGGGCCALF